MEKILKDDKLYSLIEFREKIYEDLELSKSDLTTLLGNVDFSIDDTYPWSRFCVSNIRYKTSQKIV